LKLAAQARCKLAPIMAQSRFPPRWSVEETALCFIVRDANKQALAFVYCEDEPGRQAAAKLLTRDEARRIAANIAKLSKGKRSFDNLPAPERIERAKAKMEKVLDHFLHLLALHANNAHVVYSSILSAQIPPSYAANAFNVFQQSMHQIAVVRLCALWDGVDPEKENIRTVIELIDNEEVIQMLVGQVRLQRAGAIHFGALPMIHQSQQRK
jgi:hypothetical protein